MALLIFQNVVGRQVGAPRALDPRRKRLSTIVGRHADRSRPFIVSISRPGQALMPADDTVVLRAQWRRTLVPRGATVVVTYVPMGGGSSGSSGGQGKAIGGALAMIALAVVAPYAVGALGGVFGAVGALSTAGKIAAAGIVMGGGYLISRATQAKANKQSSDSAPLYGVSGGGNMPQPGGRIPVGYGQFWTQPDLSQPDYIINDGEDQVLYKRMTLGLGRYEVERINVGQATLWTPDGGIHSTFVGGEIQIIGPGETSSLVPGTVISSPDVGGAEIARSNDAPNPEWSGPWPVTPPGITTKKIQIDFSLPYGCYMNWGKDGRQLPIAYDAWFEYAAIDNNNNPIGGWQQLYRSNQQLNTTRAQRFTRVIDVPPGRYAVRAQNTQPKEFVDGYGTHRLYNDLTWDGLRAPLDDTIIRPDVTEIAIKIRSGKTLVATSFADIWVRATRRLPVWNGSSWTEQPTRKAVWAWTDIMRSAYGGNLLDSQIDATRALHYAGTLSALDTWDGVIRGPVSVHEAASTVLGVIRADPVRIGNTWSIGRDEPRAVAKHLFTRRQIVRDSSQAQFQVSRDDGQADVIVEYTQDSDPRRRREARATFGSASLTPRRYSAAGVSTYEHAHHLATWMAASAYYRRERRTITVEHEGRLVARGDPARVDVWYMSDAVAAGVMAQSGYEIALDTDVDAAGKYAIFRNRRNREWGPVGISQGANAHAVTLNAADVAAAESNSGLSLGNICDDNGGDMVSVLIGPLTELQDAYIIDSATPQGRDRVTIEAVRDSANVWAAIGQPVPPEPEIPSRGDMDGPAVPVIPWLRAAPIQKTNSLDMEWAVGVARGGSRYVVNLSYDDGATWELVSDGPSTSGTYALRYVEGMAAKVSAFAESDAGVQGPTVYASINTYLPVVDFNLGSGAVDWDALSDQIRYEISLISKRGDDLQQWASDYFSGVKFPEFDWSEIRRGDLAELDRRIGAAIERLAAAEATTTERQFAQSELIKVELTKGDLDNWTAIETEKTARISADESLAQVTTTLSGRLTTAEGTLSGQATAISGFETRVQGVEGGITSVSERVDTLQNTVTEFAPIVGWNFRDDLEGWTGSPSIGHDISNGNLYYTKNSVSANVYVGNLNFQAGQAPQLRIRYRRATGTAAVGLSRIRFKSSVQTNEWHSGNWVELPAAPNTEWIVATIKMTDAVNWSGAISLIMFVGSDGVAATDQFVIDYIQVGGPGANVSASAIDKLTTSVTATTAGITAASQRVTTLENKVDDPNTGLTAQATAHDELKTRVTTAEGTISSTSTRVTALESTAGKVFVSEKGWGFNSGLEGWTGHASIGHDVSGGNLYYTKNSVSANVYVGNLNFQAGQAPQLRIRYRRATGTAAVGLSRIRFKSSVQTNEWHSGNWVALPAAPNTDWIEATIDMTQAANWQGDISLVMFLGSDGVGSAGQFVVDYIYFGRDGPAASAGATSTLETRVEETASGITSLSSSVTALSNKLNTTDGTVAATSNALGALTTRVSNAEGRISSSASDITDLKSTVNHPTNGVAATASAVDSLETRVDATEGGITSISNRTTALESKGDNLFVAERGWGFNAGLEGWMGHNTASVWHDTSGLVNFTKNNVTAGIYVQGLSVPTTHIPTLKIRYRRATGSGNAQCRIRWRTSSRTDEWSQWRPLPAATNADWIEATIDMTADPAWTGDLTMLMFSASEGNALGQWAVDFVMLGRLGLAASAGAVSQMETRVTAVDGRVTSEASRIDTLRSDVNGQSGSITTLQNVVSGPNGLSAQYGIVLDMGQGINGGFTVVGARRLDGSGYVETRFRGDMFVDGTITAPKIITNQVVITNTTQMGGSTVVTNAIGNNAVSNLIGFSQQKYINETSDAIQFNVRPGAQILIQGRLTAMDGTAPTEKHVSDLSDTGYLNVSMNEVNQTNFRVKISRTQVSSGINGLDSTIFAVIDPAAVSGNTWRWFKLFCDGWSPNITRPLCRFTIVVLELAR